ncbi:type I restriction enzyme, R subunit [Ectothiorhodospira mobilis]|uniref:Type I restriction enzyme endonuclease subunit n=1 Tax=Ectothiorhodospira mobilis TaxID=195064 RepID=A0A1I4SVF8_ECTMO|nr:type I restriction endonuclease subunit R [Ectothiorhodospira mobilis]SFM68395.1 type I restriction enzyme, R subunit [Ectothiorhodospira mobilis]
MGKVLSEQQVEQAALGWFEALGFDVRKGADISPGADSPLRESHEHVILEPRLRAALRRINRHLPEDAVEQAVRIVARPPEPTLFQNNRWFHRLLTDGIDVEYRTPDGETRGDKAWLADFSSPGANDLMVVHQFTVKAGNSTRRADLVVFLNGLPIAVIELKDPADVQADLWKAYRQLQDYKEHVPALFHYNELMVISDGDATRVGSLTAGADRFAPWRSIEDAAHPGEPTLEALATGLFAPQRLLDYLRHCVIFEEDDRTGEIVKKIAGYHQFRAMQKARASVKAALRPPAGEGDGRGGVIWHTQGSGKSLTMLMLSGALIGDDQLANPTVVVVTDRNDLDGQLFGTFAAGRALLRQQPEQADSRDDLAARLNRASGGVVFTTIQKFEERDGPVSERSNIVVLADEAHRSQYGFLEGGARWMRDAIPNATFVGFTGTPLERDDRSTPAVFGDYADVYDIRQAIEDNATVPIYYEMRLVKLVPDEQGVREAEEEMKVRLAAEADKSGQKVDDYIRVELEALAGARERLRLVAREIVEHFEKRREVIEGKAMAVCMSREICMNLYDEIVALRPDWHAEDDDAGFVKVVMTGSAAEGERVTFHSRTKARREALARRFKDPEDDLRLVIVCDMWLTGFDCPPMHTMYLDKPLAGHNLMQAIARVNRVFGEKPGGVVVDFLGIADQLRDAVQTYTQAGGAGSPVEDIQNEAVPLMERQFEALRDFFNGFNYSGFFSGNEADQLGAVTAGADYVFQQDDGKRRFMTMVTGLSKAFALSVPRQETEAIRDHLAYFQAVRAAIRKRLGDDKGPPPVDSRAAVRQVISGAIASDGVIDLFQAAGLAEQNIGILSDDFLDRLAALPHKNLALETLRKLLNDQIRSRERVNIVESRSFRESLETVLTRYTNRAITTAQVIEELIGLAREIREAAKRGEASGLTDEELAFYDALADNESAREVIQDDTLRLIARELSERIKAKASLDWTQRDAVRADMRRTVRRLLAKYGYPPDAQEAATQLVIKQAELMAEGVVEW